jgi:hypothetical protein
MPNWTSENALLRVANIGYQELNLSNTGLYFLLDGYNTSCPYRIAHYLHIIDGNNEVAPLQYFSDHVIAEENEKHLPSCIGPRIRNWIGPHELSDSIEADRDRMEREDAYQSFMAKAYGVVEHGKPKGVDQLYETYFDIVNDNPESTIIVRDPEIDLANASMLVPDLISISFVKFSDHIIINANFGGVDGDTDYINDLWFLMHLRSLYELWFKTEVRLYVKICNALEPLTLPVAIAQHDNYSTNCFHSSCGC